MGAGARRGLLSGALVVCVGLVASCRGPTEIVLVLSTDAPCSRVVGTTITVGSPLNVDDRPPTASSSSCVNGDLGELVIVPSGAKDDELGIRVVAGLGRNPQECVGASFGSGCILGRRVLRFVPHEKVRIEIPLRLSCDGILCDAQTTCVDGTCRSANVDPSPSDDAAVPPLDAARDAADAQTSDASSDARDALVDGPPEAGPNTALLIVDLQMDASKGFRTDLVTPAGYPAYSLGPTTYAYYLPKGAVATLVGTAMGGYVCSWDCPGAGGVVWPDSTCMVTMDQTRTVTATCAGP